MTVYRIVQDPLYNSLTIARRFSDDFYAQMRFGGLDCELRTRGTLLAAIWDEKWVFVPYIEDPEPHPKGLGDFAMFGGRLIGVTTSLAKARFEELVGDAAEILAAKSDRGDLWIFNITRAIDREDIPTLGDGEVFRINPTRNDLLCGPGFKAAVERNDLHGLRFREVDPRDRVPMV